MGYFGREPVQYGTNGRGPAGAKAPVVGTGLKGDFGGELFPYGTNDRGPAGANAPAVGINLRGYFGGELFPHCTNYRGSQCHCPCCGQKPVGVFWGRVGPTWYQ